MSNILAVIPARYKSKRFEGKLLFELLGKPVISWVIDNTKKTFDNVVVASNDKEIHDYIRKYHRDTAIIETEEARCGTERAYLAWKRSGYDFLVSIPSDECFIQPKEVQKINNKALELANKENIVTLYSRFFNQFDIKSNYSCKIITDKNNNFLYSSRSVIPINKKGEILPIEYYKKHVGITYFSKSFLDKEGENLWNKDDSSLADLESLEQNRFVDFGYPVKLLEIKHNFFGLDNPFQVQTILSRAVVLSEEITCLNQ